MARKVAKDNGNAKTKPKAVEKPNKKQEAKPINYEILSIVVIFACVFIGLSFFTEVTGKLGEGIQWFFKGLFGVPAYLVCILMFICAIGFITKRKFTQNKGRYTLMWILISFISSFWHMVSKAEMDITGLWNNGSNGIGGGFIGGLISIPLNALCSFWGTIIIDTAVIIILIITIFDISIFEAIKSAKERISGRIEASKFNDDYYEDDEYIPKDKNERMPKDVRKDLYKLKKEILDFEKEFAENPKDKKSKKTKKSNEPEETKYDPNDILPGMRAVNIEPDKQQVFGGVRTDDMGEEAELPEISIEDAEKEEKLTERELKIREMEEKQSEVQATQNPDIEKIDDAIEAATEVALLPKKKKKVETESVDIDIDLDDDDEEYKFPPVGILREGEPQTEAAHEALERTAKKLIDTLNSFGVEAKIVDYSRGPTITRYELQPGLGVKISKITNLADDIALNLGAEGIRIEPIAGKTAIGIEVPNEVQSAVYIREVLATQSFANFKSKLAFALGKDIAGSPVVGDIARMPHLLIAGSTGSGKSVCINTLITSILYKAKPNEVKLVMVDPKVVELGVYNGVPHLLIPVVTDPRKAAGALQWAVNEMTNRYKLFADTNVRDLKGYNAWAEENDKPQIPQIVIIIDELADLMMVAPNDVEDSICRLAQMARAAGMHLVIATQRPSVDVITGIIKANIPSRIAFAVSSYVDSKTILDMGGAEKLLGKGDMLYYPIGSSKPIRVQGAFVSDKEVEQIVEFTKTQNETLYDEDVIEQIENAGEKPQAHEERGGDADELLPQAVEMAIDAGQASVAMYQRRLKVGYQRAARLIDQMETRGIIGPFDGTKPREVRITKAQWQEMFMNVDVEEHSESDDEE